MAERGLPTKKPGGAGKPGAPPARLDKITAAGGILAAVVGAIALFYSQQQTHLARESLMDTQRAFVYPTSITFTAKSGTPAAGQPAPVIIDARVSWKNSGNTPTEHLHVGSRFAYYAVEPDFTCPIAPSDRYYLLGPQADNLVEHQSLTFEPSAVTKRPTSPGTACRGQAKSMSVSALIFWGWAEYRDVFQVAHFTHFCAYMLPASPPKPGETFEALYCPHGNCADDECAAVGIMPPDEDGE